MRRFISAWRDDDITNLNIVVPCRLLVIISTGAHAVSFGKHSCHLLVIRLRIPVPVYIKCLERCAKGSIKKRKGVG
jgi:hypothetical protein